MVELQRCARISALSLVVLAVALSGSVFASTPATDRQRVSQTAAGIYKRAEAKIAREDFEAARQMLTKAAQKHPRSGVFVSGVLTEPYYPHYLLGVLHMELEQYDVAIREFQLEEEQGQIQHDPELYESLKLRLARAKRTDNQDPVIQSVQTEVVESLLEDTGEMADVRFSGTVVDAGGVGSLTIDEREIPFRQSDEGFTFDEVLRMDPVPRDATLVVTDVTGNETRQSVPIDLPPLNLGSAVSDFHALIVGVNRYRTDPDETIELSGFRHQDGSLPAGETCPVDDVCGDPDALKCYNLGDLNAAAQDAERVHRFLLRRGVPPENMTLLVSKDETLDATYARVRAALDDMETREGDTALFFFAGHGVNSRRQKNLMLLSDTEQWECGNMPSDRRTELERSAIGVDEVEKALMKGRFTERYVVLDACRTPRMASTRSVEAVEEAPAGFTSRGLNVVSEPTDDGTYGRDPVVFYATFDKSVSVEWNVKKAGYFTWYLLQGMRRDLSLWELKTFVQDSVQARTRLDHGLTQKPHVVLPPKLENDYNLQKTTRILGK